MVIVIGYQELNNSILFNVPIEVKLNLSIIRTVFVEDPLKNPK